MGRGRNGILAALKNLSSAIRRDIRSPLTFLNCMHGTKKMPLERGQQRVSAKGQMGSICGFAESVALLDSASGVKAATEES